MEKKSLLKWKSRWLMRLICITGSDLKYLINKTKVTYQKEIQNKFIIQKSSDIKRNQEGSWVSWIKAERHYKFSIKMKLINTLDRGSLIKLTDCNLKALVINNI